MSQCQIHYSPVELHFKGTINAQTKNSTTQPTWFLRWMDIKGRVSYSELRILKFYAPMKDLNLLANEFLKSNFDFAKGEICFQSTTDIKRLRVQSLIEAQFEQALFYFQIRSLSSQSLFQDFLKVPDLTLRDNFNWSVGDDCSSEKFQVVQQQGYQVIKLKMSAHFQENLSYLIDLTTTPGFEFFKWRLDFNSALNFDEVYSLLETISGDIRPFFSYQEDPCPFDFNHWNELNQIIPVAVDFELDTLLEKMNYPSEVFFNCPNVIIKPSLTSRSKLTKFMKYFPKTYVTMTSSMQSAFGLFVDYFQQFLLRQSIQNFNSDIGFGTLQLLSGEAPFKDILIVQLLTQKQAVWKQEWLNEIFEALKHDIHIELEKKTWFEL